MPTSHATPTRLLADLFQLGRILTFRCPLPDSLSPDMGKLPWLVLLYALVAVVCSIALNGNGVLVPDVLAFAPFGAVACLAGLLGWIDRHQDGGVIWLVFTLLLLMLPLAGFIGAKVWPIVSVLDVFNRSSDAFLNMPYMISVFPHLWLMMAGTVFVARRSRGWRWVCVPLTFLALFAIFTTINPLAFWQPVEDEETPAPSVGLLLDEEVFYGQPRILEERLTAIEPGKPRVPEIFFLGVAGSEESVFMREVMFVEQLFRQRYATSGHSLILVNNPATAQRFPFASRQSLSRALSRMGRQMNPEDLLFLFLTSHGFRSGVEFGFSVNLRPFGFADITPGMLRKALDDAGIRRSVIVVSACYSGGFIPALANENTLVITAAAADRTSFGCSDSNELTDFGQAYFNEALRETLSFTEAFERARAVIAEREQVEGILPSLPQMAGGEALKAPLEEFAKMGISRHSHVR